MYLPAPEFFDDPAENLDLPVGQLGPVQFCNLVGGLPTNKKISRAYTAARGQSLHT